MTRTSLNKRLHDLEKKAEAAERMRVEAEAREVTPERFQEIMLGLNTACRKGDRGASYLETLKPGEFLRVHRERLSWGEQEAGYISSEHISKLLADGLGIECFSDAELFAFKSSIEDDGIDWDSIPAGVLEALVEGPNAVDPEDLVRRYPSRG